jgi:hypothetical protein
VVVEVIRPAYRRQLRANEGFDLIPNARITFDFGVGRREDTVIPEILIALDRIHFIVESKISNNSRVCGIGRTNFWLAVEKSIWLIEIDRLGDVGRDNRVVLPNFGDAIDLDSQNNGDVLFFQFTRQVLVLDGPTEESNDNDRRLYRLPMELTWRVASFCPGARRVEQRSKTV